MSGDLEISLLHVLEAQARKYADSRVALRYLAKEGWRDVSWTDYLRNVEAAAHGLHGLGLGTGDKLALLSTNCPQWFYTDLATQALGAATVAIYPNNTPDQIEYIVEHSESKILVVEGKGALEKTRPLLDKLECLEQIVVYDDALADERIVSFDRLLLAGAEAAQNSPDAWRRWLDALEPGMLATIQYTSGTTGPPKGAMLSHGNLICEANTIDQGWHMTEEETISVLPLSHIAERLQGVCIGLYGGNKVTFARSLDTLREDLLMVRPTVLACVPRLYEKFYAGITESVKTAGGLKEKLFNWSLGVGEQVMHLRNQGNQPVPLVLRLKWGLAQALVVEKLKASLGVDRCRMFISGAAPLSATVSSFFGSLGMDIYEVYGQTECVGVCTANPRFGVRPGLVGQAVPGQEVRIAGDGEILIKGGNVFLGYHKDPEATAEALVDGWLHTGDVGEFDDEGYLRVTDRKKDIIVTAGGKNVAPQNIENILKTYTGISQVVVLGDKRKYLTALITLDAEALPAVGAELGIDPGAIAEPHTHDALIGRIQGYVDEVNTRLARYETVKYFRLLPVDFSIESGEMTPSLKVKRRVVQERYASVINQMYDGPEV